MKYVWKFCILDKLHYSWINQTFYEVKSIPNLIHCTSLSLFHQPRTSLSLSHLFDNWAPAVGKIMMQEWGKDSVKQKKKKYSLEADTKTIFSFLFSLNLFLKGMSSFPSIALKISFFQHGVHDHHQHSLTFPSPPPVLFKRFS